MSSEVRVDRSDSASRPIALVVVKAGTDDALMLSREEAVLAWRALGDYLARNG